MGQQDIYLFLKKNKGRFYTSRQLGLYTNCTKNTAAKAANKLVNSGFIDIKHMYNSVMHPRYGLCK